MAAKYNGYTADQWRSEAEIALWNYKHAINEVVKQDYWRQYTEALANAKKAEELDGKDDPIPNPGSEYTEKTLPGGGKEIHNSKYANTLINGTGYRDYINNTSQKVTVYSGAGDDTIVAFGDGSKFYAEAGRDSIDCGSNVLVDGGADNDTIIAHNSNVTIYGGAGDDSIYSYEGTVNGGTGKDTIDVTFGNNLIQYANGDGNDLIKNFTTGNATLSITGGTYSSQPSGKDVLVKVGNGIITLEGAFGETLNIKGTPTPNPTPITTIGGYFHNTYANVQVSATSYADTIHNESSGKNVTIEAYGGNDSIYNAFNANYVTINAGEGNDTIDNRGNTVKVDTGAGNDSIFSYSDYATIKPGTGDDTVSLFGGSRKVIQYASGDGNDVIYQFSSSDTLSITSGTYSTTTQGSDVLVKVGSGTVTLKGAKGMSLNIIGTPTPAPTPTPGPTIKTIYTSKITVYGTSYGDTLKNFGDTVKIDTGAGNDSIYSYSYYSTIKPGTGNDTVSLSSFGHHNIIEYASGDGNDVIYNLGLTDTLSITSGTYSTQQGSSSNEILVKVGSGTVTLKGAKGIIKGTPTPVPTPTIKGGVIKYNFTSGTTVTGTGYADTLYNYAVNVKMDGKAGNDSISSFSGGSKVTLIGGAGNDTIKSWSAYSRIEGGDNADQLYSDANYSTVLGGAGNDSIANFGTYSSILGGADKDTISNYASNSTLNGGTGNDSISSFSGGARVTIIGGTGNDTIKSWGAYSRIEGGDNADQLYSSASYSTILGGAGNDSILNYGTYNSILGGADTDTLENAGYSSTLNGGTGNDILRGGSTKDTLIGGKGNDSLWGGNGADTFIYANGDGKDVIYGFGNNDLLQITGAFSTFYNKSKKEAYFKVGSTASAITLKNFTATTFNVNGSSYKISGTKLIRK